jgi:hypothetical protein
MAVSAFPQNRTLQIENFSAEMATFPQELWRISSGIIKKEENLPSFPLAREKTI